MTQRLVTKDFSLEDQRQEINQLAADQATFYNNDTDVIGPNTSISTSGTATFGTSPSSVHINSAGDAWVENAFYVGDISSPTISLSANGTASFGSGNHVLNADGTATFAGTIQSGGNPNSGTAAGTSINEYGTVRACQTSGSSTVFEGYTKDTTAATFTITAAGAGTFDGTVQAAIARVKDPNSDNPNEYIVATPDGTLNAVDNSGNSRWGITTAGAATFSDTVQSGGYPFQGTANGSALMSGSGCLASYETAASFLWRGYTTGTSTPTSSITAGGFAEFKQTVKTTPDVGGTGQEVGFRADYSDPASHTTYIGVRMSSVNYSYVHYDGSAKTSSITLDGDAMFAGRINVGSGTLGNIGLAAYNDSTTASQPTLYAENDQTSGNLFLGYGGGAEKVKITGNGAATFKGVVVADRSTSGDGCFQAALNGTVKAAITSAGAATFTSATVNGDVNIGDPTPNWASRLDVTGGTNQSAITAATTSDTYKCFVGLNSSGSDVFTVTGQGHVTTYGTTTVKKRAVGEITALTDASTVAVDMSLASNYSVTLAGNRTLGQPTNQVAGQSGSIFVTQDGTGSRTLAYHADWKWAGGSAPTLSTAANAVDRIDYIVAASNKIHAVASLAVA